MIRIVTKYYRSALALTLAQCDTEEVTTYDTEYDGSICMAECIRSICVNLAIDPDTVDGITTNIIVHRKIKTANEPEPDGLKSRSNCYQLYDYKPCNSLCNEVRGQKPRVLKLKIWLKEVSG